MQRKTMMRSAMLDEQLPDVFAPAGFLPVQYAALLRKSSQLDGERQLMLCVLEDAINCFTKYFDCPSQQAERRFDEARRWIELRDPRWLFSFDNVCQALDLEPEYIRRRLEKWKQGRRANAVRPATPIKSAAPRNNPSHR